VAFSPRYLNIMSVITYQAAFISVRLAKNIFSVENICSNKGLRCCGQQTVDVLFGVFNRTPLQQLCCVCLVARVSEHSFV